MRENFERSLAVTLPFEGGWSDHPKDPGGATMKGITLATYRRYYPSATKTQLRNISNDNVQKIYRIDYWQAVSGDTLDAGVDLAAFDAAVNSGPGRAKKWLMASVGGTAVERVKKLCGKRLGFMQSLKIWSTFGKGWSRRVAAIEAKGVAWAVAASGKPAVKEVLAQEEKAAGKQARKNAKGAGGVGGGTVAGGGDIAINPQHVDAISGWIIGGLLILGIGLVVFLVARSVIHKHRADAFAAEAKAVR
mgnify:CR=1 FL=1